MEIDQADLANRVIDKVLQRTWQTQITINSIVKITVEILMAELDRDGMTAIDEAGFV